MTKEYDIERTPGGLDIEEAGRRIAELEGEVREIDVAFDRLNAVLDTSGALEAESTQLAAYELRLAIVTALNDPERIRAASASLKDLRESLRAAESDIGRDRG